MKLSKKCDVKGSEIKNASAVNGCTQSPVNKDQTGLIVMQENGLNSNA